MEKLRTYLGAILILAIAVFGYLYYKGQINLAGVTKKENVKIAQFDPSSSNVGFPTDLPLESDTIGDHTSQEYIDRRQTLYSISYKSGKQMEELYALYQKYFNDKGYKVKRTEKTSAVMDIDAVKAGEDITVTITPQDGFNAVKLAVLYTY